MESNRKYYIECIALDAMDAIKNDVLKNIPQRGTFSFRDLKGIVEFFGGDFREAPDDDDRTYIEKSGEDSYTIEYSKKSNYLQVIHELGHVFLGHLANLSVGQRIYCRGVTAYDNEAALFARAFIMPRNDFEKVVIDNTVNGKCDIRKIAEAYGIDYVEVIARGKELDIWE